MTWLDVLGWAGSGLLVWSLLQTRLLRLRALNLVGCFVLIGYNTAIRVWPMVGLNVVLAGINLWYLAGRRVLTPPGMVAPYYGRLGFRKAGDSYVLEW